MQSMQDQYHTTDPAGYPRVLIVNAHPFETRRHTGVTLTNLFRGWPPDRLAQIYLSDFVPEFDVCRQYWKLGNDDVLRGMFKQRSLDRSISFPPPLAGAAALPAPAPFMRRIGLGVWIRRLFSRSFFELLNVWLWQSPYVVNNRLRAWVWEFQPDVIYSMLGSMNVMQITLLLAESNRVPIVPQFNDDWISTLYQTNPMAAYLRGKMMRLLDRILERASRVLVIGDLMGKEYAQRYRIACETFMNCVQESAYPAPRPRAAGPIRFVYIGDLHTNRWQPLMETGQVLSELAREGLPNELLVYTYPETVAKYGRILSGVPAIQMKECLPNEVMPQVLVDADCLVHVESFDAASRTYTKFSVSTKIPEYLMAGRCIFAYGPLEVASLRYISDEKVGVVVGVPDQKRLRDALAILLRSPAMRNEYGARGRALARARHAAQKERDRFRRVLCEVTHEWREAPA